MSCTVCPICGRQKECDEEFCELHRDWKETEEREKEMTVNVKDQQDRGRFAGISYNPVVSSTTISAREHELLMERGLAEHNHLWKELAGI